MHALFYLAQTGGGEATRVVFPALDELIWGAIAFTILFVLLSRVAFPAMRKGLEAREQAIRGELERAEQARLEAEQRREEYEGRLASAREDTSPQARLKAGSAFHLTRSYASSRAGAVSSTTAIS